MNLFSLTAYAAEAAQAQPGAGSMVSMLLPFVLVFVVMYFVAIRPQKKQEKLKKEMLSQLIKGDQIVTIGGIHGKIVSIKDDIIVLETGAASAGEKSFIKIGRWAVAEVTKPGKPTNENSEETGTEDAE